jgi:hypothetical protein
LDKPGDAVAALALAAGACQLQCRIDQVG